MKTTLDDTADASAWRISRIFSAVIAVPLTLIALLMLKNLVLSQIDPGSSSPNPRADPLWWDLSWILTPITLAAMFWVFTFQGYRSQVRQWLRYSLIGGLAFGALGFLAGFVGPMIFQPANNLGPLFALITCPSGFIAGSAAGTIYGWWEQRA